jgi:lysophospholipase L1-like esterase
VLIAAGVVLVGALLLALGLFGYAGSRMGQLPGGHPAELLGRATVPASKPVIVCLGDSLAVGTLGADWVGGLRDALGEEAVVVNAGVGGQVTWDLRQRLDDVARCRPDAVVLLVGSNDAVGSLGASWASFYKVGRPQAPSEAWFGEQYDALLGELTSLTQKVVCLTLPPLGEDPNHPAVAVVRRQNEVIQATASRHGVDVLDVHEALEHLTGGAWPSPAVPFLSGLTAFMTWTTSSILQHQLLGRSWDRIAERRGLALSTDTIHPSDRAGRVLLELVETWARRALSLGKTS